MAKVSFFTAPNGPTFAPASTWGAAPIHFSFISFFMPHLPVALSTLLLSLGLAGSARAQTATPADTARFYKHHLGLTASPVLDGFFRNNRSLPVGLLYKRQTATNKLWRFGLVVNQNYSRRDEFNPNLPITLIQLKNNQEYVYNNFGVSVSLGQELTHRFSTRWTGVVGADANVGFSRSLYHTKDQRTSAPPSAGGVVLEDELVTRNRFYQVALTPFVGLRYNVWPSLYLTAESAVSLAYTRVVFDSYNTTTIVSTGEIIYGINDFDGQTQTDQRLRFNYRIINQFAIHYILRK